MKKILVFSNGEKIGDGIIKLPLLNEVKKRLPGYHFTWVTNLGSTVFNSHLKNIAGQYIDKIIEKVNLRPYFWKPISINYNFENEYFDYIFDTQKAVYRTIALKRIKCDQFISACGNGIFSTKKIKKINKSRNYYLYDLYELLDLIKEEDIDKEFKIEIPKSLQENLKTIFYSNSKYIGMAPGAGEKNKIWPLEKFIEVGKFYQKNDYEVVLYLGPDEKYIKERLLIEFPNAILPEDLIKGFSNVEIVMGTTKFLSCAITNDSGISHMLSTGYCPLIKLFGPKDSLKFTPKNNFIKTISSVEMNSKEVKVIPVEKVLIEANKILN
jgi:ADP-heptose:LPS heptosyltransferase